MGIEAVLTPPDAAAEHGFALASFDQSKRQGVAKHLTIAGFHSTDDAKDEIGHHDHRDQNQAYQNDSQHGAGKKSKPNSDLKVECFFGMLGIELRIGLSFFDQKQNEWGNEACEKSSKMSQYGQGAVVGGV